MSRRRKHKEHKYYRDDTPQRDIRHIANERTLLRDRKQDHLKPIEIKQFKRLPVLTEDRRFYDPHKDHQVKLLSGVPAAYRKSTPPALQSSRKDVTWYSSRQAFADPFRTQVCVRRKSRREVLFAMRKVGRGKRVAQRRRYTEYSTIVCK